MGADQFGQACILVVSRLTRLDLVHFSYFFVQSVWNLLFVFEPPQHQIETQLLVQEQSNDRQ